MDIMEEPAIVSANDAPIEDTTPIDIEFIEPSSMPLIKYLSVSTTLALGWFVMFTQDIVDREDGMDYERLFYTHSITWIPSTAALMTVIFTSS